MDNFSTIQHTQTVKLKAKMNSKELKISQKLLTSSFLIKLINCYRK